MYCRGTSVVRNFKFFTPFFNFKQLSFLTNITIPTYVTDFINRIVQILKQDLRQLRISAQDTELIKPVKL